MNLIVLIGEPTTGMVCHIAHVMAITEEKPVIVAVDNVLEVHEYKRPKIEDAELRVMEDIRPLKLNTRKPKIKQKPNFQNRMFNNTNRFQTKHFSQFYKRCKK